ncbi:MAG: alpha/beta fold hydrolase [Betaproteobacteria bacterium]|nr:alpha/beta fold hydrolase [Betaproteobacteria bacterium]
MAVEWAWIKPQRPVDLPDRGIFLPAEGRCMVMLLHGLTGSPTELGYIAYHLQYRGGYAVHCPRLINHGQPLSILARTTWEQLYDSARQVFLEAREAARAKGVPLVIGGLSLGAVLCLILAAEFPGEVAGVACLSPTLFYDGWNVPWMHKLIPLAHYSGLKYFAYFREDAPFGLRDEELREKIAAQYNKTTLRDSAGSAALGYAHFPVRLFCEMRHLIAWCKRILPQVTCPVLLVQAENDDMTSPKNSQYIIDRISSSWRELILLKKSYHVVTADLERRTVAAHLQRFCDAVVELRSAPACDEAM